MYMIALLVAVPLHTGGAYWSLGERKYELFQRISFLCLGCWLAAALWEHIWNAVRGRKSAATEHLSFSTVDWAVACYGACVLLSAVFSGYGELAWKGYEGWRMGAVSQLIFVGIYFFVSRRYEGERLTLYLGEAAVCLVTLFGLLHRLGIDPLGLLSYWRQGDWEYSHMLSTLGNINWLCGYYSVALAFVMDHYLRAEKWWDTALMYVAALAGFVLLGVQGSQGGQLILAVCVAVCLLLGWRQRRVLKKVWALSTGFFLCMPVMGLLMKLRGDKAAVVEDGDIFRQVGWPIWLIAAVVCAATYFLLVRKGNAVGRLLRRRRVQAVLICAMAVGITAAVVFALVHGIDDDFGSGRGFLWRISVEGFLEADMKGKLLGAGPDCYGEEIFGVLGAGTTVWSGTHWDGAVYTNAHNEVLTQLCNVGILGTVCYVAIFLTGWRRYLSQGRSLERRQGAGSEADPGGNWIADGKGTNGKGQGSCDAIRSGGKRVSGGKTAINSGQDACGGEDIIGGRQGLHGLGGHLDGRRGFGCPDISGWLGPLAIAMYGFHSMISFQQVLNTPLLFLVLGVCEQRMRAQESRGSKKS